MSDDIDAPATTAPDADERAATAVSEKDAKETETPSRKRGIAVFLRDVAIIVVAAIVISFLIKTFLIRSFYIPSESMEASLYVNDRIIVNQLQPELVPVQHGDVIVFQDPGGWLDPVPQAEQAPVAAFFDWLLSIVGLTAPDSNDHLIKRVIGMPGDTVACCNDFGQLTINGVPIDESPYVQLPPGVTKVSRDDFEVTVPEGSLWVMGDNRYNSRDSRYNRDQPGNGFVPIDRVVGRAILISWPIQRWTWLDNYPVVFAGVEESRDEGETDPGSDEPDGAAPDETEDESG